MDSYHFESAPDTHTRQPRVYAEHDTAALTKCECEARLAGWVVAIVCGLSLVVAIVGVMN